MRLNSIRIRNYKGFEDSGTINLGKHWTVVVGRNNAGKTALVECLAFRTMSDRPHLNISQDPNVPRDPNSRIDVSLNISGPELKASLLRTNSPCDVPLPSTGGNIENYTEAALFQTNSLNFEVSRNGSGTSWYSERYPSHGLFVPTHGQQTRFVQVRPHSNLQSIQDLGVQGGDGDTVARLVGEAISNNSYVFRAERRVLGTSSVQENLILNPDASNLAGALHYFYTSNPSQFNEFLKRVRQVVSDVEMVTIVPFGGGVQIRVWNSGYREGRSDLAIPLEECGTGIGQVLAILFVASTADSGQVIVVDEPNSFLHPGASRVLMELLRTFDRHQFIITTHSPTIIGATTPDKLVVVQWKNHQSTIEVHDGAELAGIQTGLSELGVRLSDVFGYDAIVWVEGKTEERCFPLILGCAGTVMPPRAAFVSVVHTGDFEGPNAATFLQAYKRLANRSPFIPPAISIAFDRENRNQSVLDDWVFRESSG